MRSIPALSVLCLRVVGSSRCSAEDTFAKVPENKNRSENVAAASSSNKTKSKAKSTTTGSSDSDKDKKDTAAADGEGKVTTDADTATTGEEEEENKSPSSETKEKEEVKEPTNPPRRTSVLPVDTVKKVPSTASRTLEAFFSRGTVKSKSGDGDDDDDENNSKKNGIDSIPIERTDVFSSRRQNANDVDLNHPWIAAYLPNNDDIPPTDASGLPTVPTHPESMELVSEYSSPALEVLQTYVDALVEMGRMDDSRLGLHFFQQVKRTIELNEQADHGEDDDEDDDDAGHHDENEQHDGEDGTATSPASTKKSRKRKGRGKKSSWAKRKKMLQQKKEEEALAAFLAATPTTLASFSMHNAVILDETLQSMVDSKVLPHLAVLDLTGISTLTDDMLLTIVSQCGVNLRRLSIKNCRRLTDTCLTHLANCCSEHLYSLDIGGTYNITPDGVLSALTPTVVKKGRWEYPINPLPLLIELHASGLNWGDEHLPILFGLRPWRGLSIGFSNLLSFPGFKDAVLDEESQPMCGALQSLAMPFCENLVTNALLGFMGRHLPHIRSLDVRGANQLTSLTGWYDGRATIHDGKAAPMDQSLVVLARYSGITKPSFESTLQDIPEAASRLNVVLDSGGAGLGILRMVGMHQPGNINVNSDAAANNEDAAAAGDEDVEMEG